MSGKPMKVHVQRSVVMISLHSMGTYEILEN
jgi:hypothetical protein